MRVFRKMCILTIYYRGHKLTKCWLSRTFHFIEVNILQCMHHTRGLVFVISSMYPNKTSTMLNSIPLLHNIMCQSLDPSRIPICWTDSWTDSTVVKLTLWRGDLSSSFALAFLLTFLCQFHTMSTYRTHTCYVAVMSFGKLSCFLSKEIDETVTAFLKP